MTSTTTQAVHLPQATCLETDNFDRETKQEKGDCFGNCPFPVKENVKCIEPILHLLVILEA